ASAGGKNLSAVSRDADGRVSIARWLVESHFLAGFDVPAPDVSIITGRDNLPAVGGERDALSLRRLSFELLRFLAGCRIEDKRAPLRSRGHQLAVRTDGQTIRDATGLELPALLATGNVPRANGLVIAAGVDGLAI